MNNKNPLEIRSMLDTAKKYGAWMEILTTTQEVARQLPIWYHAQADKNIHQLTAIHKSKCLLEIHHMSMVGNAEDFAKNKLTNGHCESWYCRCMACITIHSSGCECPSECIKLAGDLLETLPPRWNPGKLPTILTDGTNNTQEGWICFSPAPITAEMTKDIFRIFTKNELQHKAIANIKPEHGPSMMIATDGSAHNVGTTEAQAGAGISYYAGNPRNRFLHLPPALSQTNQTAELIAIKCTVDDNEGILNICIKSDSKYVINALTKNLTQHKDQGYIGLANADIL